jgi:sulfur relay (sulfurtransferase) complex TusBCD TusD component (DsrE family)
MKLGITLYANDPETVWNAFRFANLALALGDAVKVFLLGKGVELESVGTDQFKVAEQVKNYLDDGGQLFACGTCLNIRQMKPAGIYLVASLKELYEIVQESDRVISF